MPILMDFAEQRFLDGQRPKQDIQWRWLPLLLAYCGVWLYGAYKLVEAIL